MATESYGPTGENGVQRQVLQCGDRLMLVRITIAAGSVVPAHAHPHEQMSYLVSGSAQFTLGDETSEVSDGSSVYVPSDVPHGVTALSDCLFLDTFSPPREDFLT